MKKESDIHARCADLRERNALLRVKLEALQRKHRQINEHIARPSQTEVASGVVDDVPPTIPHDQALETLHAMRTMLDMLPLEWQVAVVKALTARTLHKVHERKQAPPTTALSA